MESRDSLKEKTNKVLGTCDLNSWHMHTQTPHVNKDSKCINWKPVASSAEERIKMLLAPRCNSMLENHCQCTNEAENNSQFCKLHNTIINDVSTKPATKLNLLHKELRAPKSNNE